MSDLKPCPFCGSTNLTIIGSCWGDNKESVSCSDCESSGPMSENVVDAWNTRYNEKNES